MDFWSRLLSHTPLSTGSYRKDAAKDPVRRRHRFEKEYSKLLQTWRKTSNVANDDEASEAIEICIEELTNILADESRRPLPHSCINYAAEHQIYVPVAKIAIISGSEWIIKEAVYFFGTLVETEEEALLENEVFASSLTNLLVRITGANSLRLDVETETRVVELAFNITTKIRLEPEILGAWFKIQPQNGAVIERDKEREKQRDSHEKFAGKTQKEDFPLFYVLMDYIHSEGKVGDFARTGLLYIIEAASSSVALEQWIVESDLSTLMATGLNALYSQLSRKLVIDHPASDLPPILAFSDYEHPRSTYEIVSSCSPEFQVQLETFLSHLLFWQDVLNHCKSVEIKSTLLEHFQVIFLKQLLYPSLLESSDIDGGSSVAVLTYLRRILESLDHPDMINLILHYLLALPDIVNSAPSGSRTSVSMARKRKSLDLATMMAAKDAFTATPLLFNLVDLILACLGSHSQQTIHVTLQLVSAILKRHHRYAVITLLRTESVLGGSSTHRTVGAHQQEVEYFMSLAGTIGGQDNFDEIYDSILKDTVIRLEGHPCSLKLVAPKVSTNNHKLPAIPDTLPGAPHDVPPHTIRPDDPLLNIILDRLETFFTNPVDTNLSVTETILDLAICGYVGIEGWLTRHPDKYVYEEEDEDIGSPVSPGATPAALSAIVDPESPSYAEFQTAESMKKCRRRPKWTASSLPRFLVVLQRLSDQVAAYRQSVPRFDELLQLRREAFQTADGVARPPSHAAAARPKNGQGNRASTPGMDRRSSTDDSRGGSPARPSALEGFAQRILSELGTPSRSGSPRGRKEGGGWGGGGGSILSGGYGFATPTSSKPIPVPPKEFPLNYESPSRGGVARSFSPSSQAASWDGRDAAADQKILAQRVGIPSVKKIEPIPLNFEKKLSQIEAPEARSESSAQNGGVVAEGAGEAEEAVEGGAVKPPTAEEDAGGGAKASSPTASEDGDTEAAAEEDEEVEEEEEEKTVSVSHVLTNTVILQSFLFELAALLQARAGLFDEVRFA